MNKKRFLAAIISVALLTLFLSGCGTVKKNNINIEDNGKLNIVTTLFPYYDFVRQIAGDKVNLTMIVPAGMDTHSFEPTTDDMINISKADIFIYNGGTIEHWADRVLDSSKNDFTILRMMDYVDIVTEEHKEGMEDSHEHSDDHDDSAKHDDEHEEEEYDEHIWTSPANAVILVNQICDTLKSADPDNADYYQTNCDNYVTQLDNLDKEFKDVVEHARVKTLVFADKFPLRYFVDEYGLDYYAAFSGCSTDTEPSVDTVKFLIDKVKKEKISTVYYLELSSTKIADTICSSTGANKSIFYSCHNVTQKQFNDGITYVKMMEENVKALKKGLE